MWNDDGGMPGHYHPPLSAERFRQIHLGYLEGYPVDCYMYPIVYSGYTQPLGAGGGRHLPV